jgi:hypothetical protein
MMLKRLMCTSLGMEYFRNFMYYINNYVDIENYS